MTTLLGTYGSTLFAMIFAIAILAGAMFAGGRPTDVSRPGGKAIMIAAAVLLVVMMVLAWRVSNAPEGRGYYSDAR